MAHPTDRAPDPRGRLVVSLLAEERLSYAEIAGLHDRDLGVDRKSLPPARPGGARRALSEHTRLALAAYLEQRDPTPGPLIRHYRTGRALKVSWLEDMVYSWRSGIDRRRRPDGTGPLYSLIRQYAEERRSAGRLAATSEPNVRRTLVNFASSVQGAAPAEVTRRDVEKWVGRAGLAPGTRRRELSTIRTFWRWLTVTGRAEHDPTVGVERVREPRRLPRGLQADQVAAVLDACPDSRARLIVTLEVQLGLRSCEVARLRVEDVNPWEWTVRISGKGGHERILPVVDEATGALRDYLAEWPATRGPLVRSYNDPTKGISATHTHRIVNDACKAAGLAETGHALRHTCATDMLLAGAHLRNVQAALGHANLATTSRYLPLVVGELRDAMAGRSYGTAS